MNKPAGRLSRRYRIMWDQNHPLRVHVQPADGAGDAWGRPPRLFSRGDSGGRLRRVSR